MKFLVSALIGKFGKNAYNVTILYGDANSKMIPVSASEISDSSVLELARKLSSELIISKDEVRNSAYYFDSRTFGSHSKSTAIKEMNDYTPSGCWILSYINKIRIDDLNQLLYKIQCILDASEFNGEVKCCGNLLNVPIMFEY